MENKKTNKEILIIVIALIMLITLISLFCICGIENEKQSNENFELANLASENQPVEGEDISLEAVANSNQVVTSTLSATEDYSNYTNQELPDNIDKNNIAQYVPVDKFNSGETIVYNGRNYGFIIVCQVGTNYVLIFREVYMPHEDGDGYDINLEVVYENNFYVTALGLIETNNGQHLGLADIKFNNFIIDADVDNFVANKDYDVQKDDGPYYIQSRYSSNFSYFNQELANEIVSFSTTALISIFAPAAGPAVKVAIDNLLDYAGTIMEVSSMSNSLVEDTFWLTDATLDTAIDFPLEREGQLETYDRLIKNLEIEMGAGSSEYITQNEKSPNFAKATFRVRNENDKDYYIYNNISFSLCRFIGGASYDLGAYSIESLYKSAVPEYNGSTKMLENEGKFQIVKGDVFAPMTLQYNATRTNLKPTSLTDYEIKDTAVAIDCSRFSLMVGIEFVIHSSAKEITFLNGTCNDTNIVVKTRSSKLNIYFSNIAINAPNGKSVINALGCNDLELYSYNSVTLRGGEASINTSAPAILCKNLFLTGNNIYIYGGNSMNLYYNGRAGIKCEGSLTVNAKNVNVFGGNGSYIPDEEEIKEESEDDKNADFGPNSSYWNNKPQAEPGKDGKDGDSGIDGSHGAVAVYVVNNIKIGNGASLYCKGGDGGYGTDGKDGEKGGDGVDGKFGKYAVEAGDGGNGGPGGNGGNGGQSIYCANINEFIVEGKSIHPGFSFDNGLGGKAGKNGHGAPPGKTSKTIFGNPTTPGVCGEGPESDELPSDGESGLSKIY